MLHGARIWGSNLQQLCTADLLHLLVPGLQALLLQRLLRRRSAGPVGQSQVPELVWAHIIVAPHEVHHAVVAQQSVDLPTDLRSLSLQPGDWRLDGPVSACGGRRGLVRACISRGSSCSGAGPDGRICEASLEQGHHLVERQGAGHTQQVLTSPCAELSP